MLIDFDLNNKTMSEGVTRQIRRATGPGRVRTRAVLSYFPSFLQSKGGKYSPPTPPRRALAPGSGSSMFGGDPWDALFRHFGATLAPPLPPFGPLSPSCLSRSPFCFFFISRLLPQGPFLQYFTMVLAHSHFRPCCVQGPLGASFSALLAPLGDPLRTLASPLGTHFHKN